MEPLAQAMQLLAEAQQTIQVLAEEVQVARQQGQEKEAPKKEITKTASITELSEIFNTDADKLPDFVKEATTQEAKDLYRVIESNLRFSSLGKVAEWSDASTSSNPAEALEERLSSIIGR